VELASVFKRYAAEGTGQLALKFADTTHLCKVDIEDGEAVFIKLGTLSPEATLAALSGKTLLEANFIKGFKTRKRLPEPITEQLVGVVAPRAAESTGAFSSAQSSVAAGHSVSAQNISKMINHYVDIVGPLGVVMMENYIKKIGYVQGNEMNSNDYNELIDKVLNDLPEAFRDKFQKMHR
jgi:hypothetical protein